MFTTDKEIILSILASAILMIFLIIIVVIAVVRYQRKLRLYMLEINNMKIAFQEEILKIQSEMEEQTFQHISEEIHDNIGQILSLAKVNLHTLRIEPDHPANKQINSINDLVGKAINDLRQLSKSLNSAQLIHQSLYECIRIEIDQISKTGLYATSIQENGIEQPIDPKKQLIIFRIIQEIFNNILKHAKANKIDVLMNYSKEFITIIVSDNGVGFDVSNFKNTKINEKGSGIGNIYRRSALLGAQTTINSKYSEGTIINISIPL